jgi:CheY-like chemotaxis protein/anti-sigma regulatory factor (Ser/Thr protein kinase)
MTAILVVDDSPVDRRLAGGLVEKRLGVHVTYAADGKEAATTIEQSPPDLVLTDLQMPHMNGLDLVDHIRKRHPLIPVILMTAHGSDEIAAQALKRGAASYVPKAKLAEDLADTIESVLSVANAQRDQHRLLECLTQTESHFVLDNDATLIPPLVGHLEAGLTRMKLSDETGLIQIAIALREAIINAMEHGNLEADSALRERDGGTYSKLLEERRRQEPYKDRRVHVMSRESRDEAMYVVRDEGPGFDPSILPDPTDPGNLEKVSGRGLLLIRTFMDEIHHGDNGRELTMIKRRETTFMARL